MTKYLSKALSSSFSIVGSENRDLFSLYVYGVEDKSINFVTKLCHKMMVQTDATMSVGSYWIG